MDEKIINPSTRPTRRQQPCSGLTPPDNDRVKKRIYCAIYTRKSTSEGLDQYFTSLDAQREATESYINSQKHEGWVALQEKYDDGGFTGANLERPGLQKLLSDIKEHKIDCVVVYKVDRLSRSLMDFAHLLEFFDKNNVTFVSVTQAFNTNTSMGRLTLNILLSFAQFEREIISERTKDKMGAARKKGKWLGGRPLLGYDIDKEAKKLVVNKDEAKIIREIFDLYLQGNSLLKVAQALNNKGYRTKRTTSENGRTFGGFKYGVTQIQSIITSVLYIGKVCYAGQIYDGEQKAIIDEDIFKKAQEKLKQNRVERKATKNVDCTGLLTHLLHCKTCKSFMFHTYTLKNETHKYRYYVCTSVQKHGYNSCPTKSVNAQAIEDATIDCLRKIFTDNKKNKDNPNKQEIDAFMSPIWDTLYPQEKRRILKALIKKIDYDSGNKKLGITLNGGDSFDAAALGGLAQDSARRASLRLEFEADLKKVRPLNRWHKEIEIDKEPSVRKMLVLAYQIRQFVNEGRIKHPREACKWLNLSVTRMDQFMNTIFLCPAIQNEILSSSAPAINALTEFKIRPLLREVHWDKQLTQWQALVENKK